MSPKFCPQSRVKNSEWCGSCGSRPSTPSIASTAPGPGERSRHAGSGCVCSPVGSSAVSRWCRSAAPTTTSASTERRPSGRLVLDAGDDGSSTCGVGGEDPRDGRAGVQPRAVLLREVGDDPDQPGEAALGVEHAVAEVEPAHQVVQARRAAGGGAQEDSGVAEHLAQPVVGERAGDVALQRPRQQPAERQASGVRRRGARRPSVSRSSCRGTGAGPCRRCPRPSGGRRRSGRPPPARGARTARGCGPGRVAGRPARGGPRRRRGSSGRARSGRARPRRWCRAGRRSARRPRA